MRRWVAAGLAVTMALSGCGPASDQLGELDIVQIGFITKFPTAFYDEMIEGATHYAVVHPDVRITFARGDSAADDDGQIALIDGMVADRVHAILVTPTSPKVQPALQRAVDAGIKVVLVDNDIPEWRDKTSVVGTDNLAGGKLAGDWMLPMLGPEASVAILQGRADNPSLNARVKGLKVAFGGRVSIVAEPETDCDEAKGADAVKAILAAHPKIAAIYSACGPPMIGAIKAIQAAGRKPGDIMLVGFDASPGEVDAIAAGTQRASVAQFPAEMGSIGVGTAVVAVRGHNVDRQVDTGTEMVTATNVYRWLR